MEERILEILNDGEIALTIPEIEMELGLNGVE